MLKNRVFLSVCMITYNHENYIQQAIEGVLMQKTDFEIELIIANDASIDKTDALINRIIATHPKANIINYFNHSSNIGMSANFSFVLNKSKGKYVAICEGDDYWTDFLKLQKQVDFLESHEEINICFHKANLLIDNEFFLHKIPNPFDEIPFNYHELLKYYNFIATASVVFRRPKNFLLPIWFKNLPFGDLGLYKLISKEKKIQCINEVMSVYRVHDNGVYSGLDKTQKSKKYLEFYKIIYPLLSRREKNIVSAKKTIIYNAIAKQKFPKSIIFQKMYGLYLEYK
ncbi:glycosyltransferase family 2 protein [Hanstruepera marina]|uniref:glycosyltransferase family 2 protein n=1 Tax=Hanstruepera marina TaxID=2873265 RepID=UPI001CA6EF6B|nr:glycosyltransferase [Hanstruepera marina]